MAQKNRKIHTKRGTRSCGYGCAQKHRGAGSRGGRGNAGTSKHHQIKARLDGKVFGKHGFKRHLSLIKKANYINLSELSKKIESWVEAGSAKKIVGGFSVDLGVLGYDKLLGAGKVTLKLEVTVVSSSAKAIEKITAAGGKVITGDDVDSV